ncbi:MAG: class II D-tagatose-bisphosphate aldolase non-catalytic subunit [Hyphomicrobiales bacterium]
MKDILHDLRSDHLAGRRGGMLSICTARREVLAAAMDMAKTEDCDLLVEATANQVNQFGGYTGLTPAEFAAGLRGLAEETGFPPDRLVLGADHLGPYVWKSEPAVKAMDKACELARQCVRAGFRKIHLDTGFGCSDDPSPTLSPEQTADRAARLCRAAESASDLAPGRFPRPYYVIGVEVPLPGGSLDEIGEVDVTRTEDVAEMIRTCEVRFRADGLEGAWERVMGVVVQPGVDFGDTRIAPYRPEKTRGLSRYHDQLPGIMTYEIHSTDYQSEEGLTRMVRDHFILLKVGPCLTNAFREAVFALAGIETEWKGMRRGVQLSNIREVLEAAMLANPVYWRAHYRGSEAQLRFLRSNSYRDRIRYYWGHPAVAAALERLMANLRPPIPSRLVEAHLPDVCTAAASGPCPVDPAAIIRRCIQLPLEAYFRACS